MSYQCSICHKTHEIEAVWATDWEKDVVSLGFALEEAIQDKAMMTLRSKLVVAIHPEVEYSRHDLSKVTFGPEESFNFIV